MNTRLRGRRRFAAMLAVVGAVIALHPARCWAVSPADLPSSLASFPMNALIGMFRTSFETPDTAAEIARYRAWLPPDEPGTYAPPALARVIHDYPGTSDARRALLDLCGLYARKGEWTQAEAPFLYVMEVAKGQPEARVAHLRLIELHTYAGSPSGADVLAECRAAVQAYAGTPEEGLGRLLLADALAEQRAFTEAFSEYDRVLREFPAQPYSSYARIRFALALVDAGEPARAREVVAAVLRDPVWGGRAHWARAKAYMVESQLDQAAADYEQAVRSADNLWVKGEAYLALAEIAKNRGKLALAHTHLTAYLSVAPAAPDRFRVRLEVARNWHASGRYVEAAQAACDLEMDVLNAPKRHTPEQYEMLTHGCEELLDMCEHALSRKSSIPPSEGRKP